MNRTLLIAALITVLTACGAKPPDPPPAREDRSKPLAVDSDQQKANRFEFAVAEMRTGYSELQTTGVIRPAGGRVAQIRPLSRGRILQVMVKAGDRVEKGQPLLTYDNVELGETVHDYLRALTALDQAKSAAEVARRSLDRANNLIQLGALAKAELDRREAEHQNTQTAIRARRAEVAQFDEKLHRFGLDESEIEKLRKQDPAAYHRELSISRLPAPMRGIVLKASVAEGENVQPTDALMDIADISVVWVEADVYAQDLASVREGGSAQVTVESYPGAVFHGRVAYIGDTVNPETRTARVRIELPNPDRRLKLELFAQVRLEGRNSRPALMVPAAAIQRIDAKPCVFVRQGARDFAMREVRIGAETPGWVEIAGGLSAGETVVTRGSFVLKSEHLKSELAEEGH